MLLTELYKKYVLNDGNISALYVNYELEKVIVEINIRLITNKKFRFCKIKFEFNDFLELSFFEDFNTGDNYSDITLVKLESGYFYMSLDPYDNSGLPNENDNLVIKAKNLIIIDEIGTSHTILG